MEIYLNSHDQWTKIVLFSTWNLSNYQREIFSKKSTLFSWEFDLHFHVKLSWSLWRNHLETYENWASALHKILGQKFESALQKFKPYIVSWKKLHIALNPHIIFKFSAIRLPVRNNLQKCHIHSYAKNCYFLGMSQLIKFSAYFLWVLRVWLIWSSQS